MGKHSRQTVLGFRLDRVAQHDRCHPSRSSRLTNGANTGLAGVTHVAGRGPLGGCSRCPRRRAFRPRLFVGSPSILDVHWQPARPPLAARRHDHQRHRSHLDLHTAGSAAFPVSVLPSSTRRCWDDSSSITTSIVSSAEPTSVENRFSPVLVRWADGWKLPRKFSDIVMKRFPPTIVVGGIGRVR